MKLKLHMLVFILVALLGTALAQDNAGDFPVPVISPELIKATGNFEKYEVILEPDKNAPEWWAGAPSVVRDEAGIFWMACRMRSPE